MRAARQTTMPEHLDFLLCTSRDPGVPVDIVCSCDDFWSVAQQFALLQLYARKVLSPPGEINMRREDIRIIPPHPAPDPQWPQPCAKHVDGHVIPLTAVVRADYLHGVARYANRALRIAGAYARVFLEDFEHGDAKRLGRFHWAGLAAFASKQVAFILREDLVQTWAPQTLRALGRGNLWLYNDALPWHYAWALCPKSVDKCARQRDAQCLDPVVLANLTMQEWSEEALKNVPCRFDEPKAELGEPIGNLKWTPLMGQAIEAWRAFETETDDVKRTNLALEHLRLMARHEQGEVLQGFTYGAALFPTSLALARGMDELLHLSERFIAFKFQISFSAEVYVSDPAWRSDAPPGIRVEDYKERMDWINDAARKYHKLMNGECRERLLAELRILGDYEG
ncbi:MAG: hypothetical protein KGJ03_11125 [Betaproteobacteria bacterium]|nr:hypothetical protein [Betaproteobacteria bacterium]MBU6512996.1 hypothetical protein [Betaproteobacteria bacterium]MDE1956264.1 hypothetical protein [Betaproteobacteria bacterium]MDE2477988.1 hypothetical protein [Betaproteobacteria bacterium]